MLPLVLLPALLCDEELYRAQTDALGDVAQPMPLAAPGATLGEAAQWVLRHVPERFALVGTSAGGNLALEVVIAAPERVAGLWLMGCNPGLHGDPDGARRSSERARAGDFEAIVDDLVARAVYAGGPRARAALDAVRRMARRVGPEAFVRMNDALRARAPRWDALDALRGPALLVWGCHDEFSSVERASAILTRMSSARLTVLEDCGHLPTLEQPDASTQAAREWLKRVSASR
jgi:pimeloyl-ACP methyl ester carboxylesterase